MNTGLPVLTPADFASDQDIRWCPGCGDYSILAQMKKVLPEIGIAPENTVFVSGIGCSSRFPYYVNTYGIHSIHGRAPAIATGLKVSRPDLTVWVITGDGDGLSIGGNHFVHVVRRNLDINYVLFNNRIYGLTKGQYSPTSVEGQITKSTPMGAVDHPLNPMMLALGAGATFIARTVDSNIKHLAATLKRAAAHKGTSFVEVYQNCNVFNDGAFSYAQDKATRSDTTIELEQGKPLIFGKNRDKGIRMNGLSPEVVDLSTSGVKEDDLLFHDEQGDVTHAFLLARLLQPDFPEPIGVMRAIQAPTFDDGMRKQMTESIAKRGKGDLQKLLASGDTWHVPSGSD
jgi:2-oxoglutarate ferredoxin oxidoreductase subunit beta